MDLISYFHSIKKELNEKKLNEADISAFAELAYLDYSLLSNKLPYKINDLTQEEIDLASQNVLEKTQCRQLIKEIINSNRFTNVELIDFYNLQEPSKNIPVSFNACTFKISNTYVVCYGGTDITYGGWYESLALSFSDNIPAQKEALIYLSNIASKTDKNSKIIIIGHSKGGNLAEWSATFAPKFIQAKISRVINLEGPGNRTNIFATENYHHIKKKVKKYITSSSIIGVMLFDNPNYKIISSRAITGVLQHSIFTWKFKENGMFIFEKERSKSSIALSLSISNWLSSFSDDELKNSLNILFSFLEEAGIKDQSDFLENFISYTKKIYKVYSKSPSEIKRNFAKSITKLIVSFLKYRFMSKKKLIKIEAKQIKKRN